MGAPRVYVTHKRTKGGWSLVPRPAAFARMLFNLFCRSQCQYMKPLYDFMIWPTASCITFTP